MTEPSTNESRIVVGVDGSPESRLALRWAERIAAAEGAVIEVIAAWEFPPAVGWAPYPEGYSAELDMNRIATDAVDAVFGQHRPTGLTISIVKGSAAGALIRAGKDAVMVIVGSRGHGGFMGLLLGSVSAKVAEHAPCPVLVVHDKPRPSPAEEYTS